MTCLKFLVGFEVLFSTLILKPPRSNMFLRLRQASPKVFSIKLKKIAEVRRPINTTNHNLLVPD